MVNSAVFGDDLLIQISDPVCGTTGMDPHNFMQEMQEERDL